MNLLMGDPFSALQTSANQSRPVLIQARDGRIVWVVYFTAVLESFPSAAAFGVICVRPSCNVAFNKARQTHARTRAHTQSTSVRTRPPTHPLTLAPTPVPAHAEVGRATCTYIPFRPNQLGFYVSSVYQSSLTQSLTNDPPSQIPVSLRSKQ